MISEKKLKKALNKKVSWFFGPFLGGRGGSTPTPLLAMPGIKYHLDTPPTGKVCRDLVYAGEGSPGLTYVYFKGPASSLIVLSQCLLKLLDIISYFYPIKVRVFDPLSLKIFEKRPNPLLPKLELYRLLILSLCITDLGVHWCIFPNFYSIEFL